MGKTAQHDDSQHLLKIEDSAVQLGLDAFIKVTTSEAKLGSPITVDNNNNLLRIGFGSGSDSNNVFIGNKAQNVSIDDSNNNNIYIGHDSGNNSNSNIIDSGKYNTVIGHSAYIGTYNNCVAIGNNVSVSQNNEIAIGNPTQSITNQTVSIGNSVQITNDIVKLGIADNQSENDPFGNLVYIRREVRDGDEVVSNPLIRIGRNRTGTGTTEKYRPLFSITNKYIRIGRSTDNKPIFQLDMSTGNILVRKSDGDLTTDDDDFDEVIEEGDADTGLGGIVNTNVTTNIGFITYIEGSSYIYNFYKTDDTTEGYASVKALNFQATSDERLKTDIQTLNIDESHSQINALRPVSFQWKNNQDAVNPEYGFIAQEVENVLPSLVHTDIKSGYKSMDYDKIIPLLVSTIQDLTKRVQFLENQIKN